MPAGKQVSVEIDDAENKPVYQKMLTVGARGSISRRNYDSPVATLGGYNIEVKSGDSVMSGDFEVEEYKKPEYEVRVTHG